MPKPKSDDEFEQFAPIEDKHSTENDSYNTRKVQPSADTNIVVLSEKDWRQKVRTRAITYLAKREYSRFELRKKILFSLRQFECEHEMAGHILEEVLDHLSHDNWQSDARVAASIAKVKGERYGSARVRHELNQQGLDNELIAQELAQLANTELRRAHEVWQNKFGQAPVDLKEKAKQVRFMASRGFGFDVINKVIKGADDLYFE